MRLFRRKPVIEFNLTEVRANARNYVHSLGNKPYLSLSAMMEEYMMALLIIHLPYQLAATGHYQVNFYGDTIFGNSGRQSKQEIETTIRKYAETALLYPPPRDFSEVGKVVEFKSTALEWFLSEIRCKNKPSPRSKLDVRDPIQFYSGDSPSIKMVSDYLNEGYM